MEYLIKLPDDLFKMQWLDYLTMRDIAALDNACSEKKYRQRLLLKIEGAILKGDLVKPISCELFEWLGRRQIYVTTMRFEANFSALSSCIESNYRDQCHHVKQLNLSFMLDQRNRNGPLTDESLYVLSACCPALQHIKLNDRSNITDIGIRAISEHCRKLMIVSANTCTKITDIGIIHLSKLCTGLRTIHLGWSIITDDSIISLSKHCKDLSAWYLFGCRNITDLSVISIAKNTTKILYLNQCTSITDASVMTIAIHCSAELTCLNLSHCNKISTRYQRLYRSISDLHAIVYPADTS